MKNILLLISIVFLSTAAYADKPINNEKGNPQDGKIKNTQSVVLPTAAPPGLEKQGKTPQGLAKQGKVPPGWNKGEKEGWDGSFLNEMQRGWNRFIDFIVGPADRR
ncbi:MAG: hypothetical protein ACD_46C00535G0007 [uncultured bacterium]|nr:MAG: hypothetical protein ACD_46C00535G0007 [uncultured bacterium]